jgi:predicted HTH transcriptional regulator
VRVVFRPHPNVEQMNADDAANDPVNERQKWYLEQLTGGVKAKAAELALHWSVSPVTAKRDISDLKERGLIEFVGSAKTGLLSANIVEQPVRKPGVRHRKIAGRMGDASPCA